MQGVGEAKMPGNVPLPLYGQRRCAAVIAGLGWFGLGVQLYFNIQDGSSKTSSRGISSITSAFSRSRPISLSPSCSRFFAHGRKRSNF